MSSGENSTNFMDYGSINYYDYEFWNAMNNIFPPLVGPFCHVMTVMALVVTSISIFGGIKEVGIISTVSFRFFATPNFRITNGSFFTLHL